MTEPTVETLKAITDAFNHHDLDAIMAFFTDDAVFESPRGPDPWGRRFEGKAAVRDGLAARFTGIPDVHYGDDGHFVAGDRGASEWTVRHLNSEPALAVDLLTQHPWTSRLRRPMPALQTNVLYYGDNVDILRHCLPDASVDLVYLDPPFNSNRHDNVIFGWA